MSDVIPIRVTVVDAWDAVSLRLEGSTAIEEVKRLALEALGVTRPAGNYMVKFRGAEVPEAGTTLSDIGVVPNSGLVVLGRRRRPVS